MNTKHLRDYVISKITLRLSTNGVGNLSRSVVLQQPKRKNVDDEKTQLNPLTITITVPDQLKVLPRNEVKNRRAKTALILLKRTGFQFHK